MALALIESEIKFQVAPADAVADAMMVAQAVQLADVLGKHSYTNGNSNNTDYVRNEIDWTTLLVQKTRSGCEIASRTVVTYLADKYPELFEAIAILRAERRPKSLIKGWNFHENFLVLGKDGTWYAGSPANYHPHSRVNRLTDTMFDASLEHVLDQIRARDGGLWPTRDFLESRLLSSTDRLPKPASFGIDQNLLVYRGLRFTNQGRLGHREEIVHFGFSQNGKVFPRRMIGI